MRTLKLVPNGWPCTLRECPPGCFVFDEEVCFKSDYGQDAYCDGGSYFWGGTSDKEARAELIVQPVSPVWEEIEL